MSGGNNMGSIASSSIMPNQPQPHVQPRRRRRRHPSPPPPQLSRRRRRKASSPWKNVDDKRRSHKRRKKNATPLGIVVDVPVHVTPPSSVDREGHHKHTNSQKTKKNATPLGVAVHVTPPSSVDRKSKHKHKHATTSHDHDHELVGTRIQKRFSPGCWRKGNIRAVIVPTVMVNRRNDNRDSTGSSSHHRCIVEYDDDDDSIQEDLLSEDELNCWIVAHQMCVLAVHNGAQGSSNDRRRRRHHQATAEPLPLFARNCRRPSKPYTVSQFQELFQYAAKSHMEGVLSLEALEASRLIQPKAKSKRSEVYGRMLPTAIDKILKDFMQLKPQDSVVDIGSGIGNSCLQAAYTIGCQARGIECDPIRNAVAQVLTWRLDDAAHIHKQRDNMTFEPGSVRLLHGNLEDPNHCDFMTKDVTHIFFDNWNGVFSGERGPDAPNLERHVAALFAKAPEGTIMTTVSPLRAALGCLPLSRANQIRESRGLATSENASYYDVEEFELGPLCDVYSFSEGSSNDEMVKLFRYVRTYQQLSSSSSDRNNGDNRGETCFLCNNPRCFMAQQAVPLAAIRYEAAFSKNGNKNENEAGTMVIGSCDCCGVSDRVMRKRIS